MLTLAAIAERLGLTVLGDADGLIDRLSPLERAGPADLSFVSKPAFLPLLTASEAGAVIIKEEWLEHWSGPCIVSADPYLSFAHATHLFDNRPKPAGQIHPSAVISPSAEIASDVTIDAGVVVEAGAILGEGVWLGANSFIGQNSQIGGFTRIYPGVVIYHDVTIGTHCTLHGNAVIGADGFGFAPSEAGWVKIMQLGGVRIGDRVEIGASTTVDRGALGDTIIDDNVLLDDQVHVAHNVHIGARTGIAACTGIAGSTVIGQDCALAGMVGVGDHLVITDNVHVHGQGRVTRSLKTPGSYASGTAIQPFRDWSKNAVRFDQLADMAKRLKLLEKQLAQLQEGEEK